MKHITQDVRTGFEFHFEVYAWVKDPGEPGVVRELREVVVTLHTEETRHTKDTKRARRKAIKAWKQGSMQYIGAKICTRKIMAVSSDEPEESVLVLAWRGA